MQFEEKTEKLYLTEHPSIDNGVTEFKLHPNVQKSLQNIIVKEGFTSYTVFKKIISTNGGNYMGELCEVDIKGETKEGKKEVNIFLKQVLAGESLNTLVNLKDCYLCEAFIYKDLKKIFNALQERADIPINERFKMVKSYNESHENAIILENLSKKGYKTMHRMDVMTIEFAELSITQLAKLHALTFVLKIKNPEYFDNTIETMNYPVKFNETWKEYFARQIDDIYKYFDSDVQQKIKSFVQILYDKLPKYFTGKAETINCLCHGDFRPNNVLFKQHDDEELEVVLIDYQIAFYGSPVVDILYFMFTGTDREFRKAHMTNLKDLYHEKLTEFLNYFDLNVNNIYPKEVFERDFDKSLDFGLMVSFYILPYIFALEDELPDFGKDSLDDINVKLDKKFKKRITEIVEEYIEKGILK